MPTVVIKFAPFMSTFGYFCIQFFSAFGETLLIAEEMSARNTLQRLFRTGLERRPLLLGRTGKDIGNLDAYAEVPNPWLHEWTEKECLQRLAARAAKTSAQHLGEELSSQLNTVQNL